MPNLKSREPLGYLDFLALEAHASLVVMWHNESCCRMTLLEVRS